MRVRSYLEPEEDGDSVAERWELELLTGSPVLQDGQPGLPDEAGAGA